jgi:2-keto-4-pentenoate hydratase/2-oxohepta-3-ene-1,7-dioic acid hydratase in catechol pathway
MRLIRHGVSGREKPGLVDDEGNLRDLAGVIPDIAGEILGAASLDKLRALNLTTLPRLAEGTRLGPCVGAVGKFICIGLNYSDHAAETGNPVPPEPIIFMKATSAICGPNDDILIPRGAEKTDWEVELGVVIGRTAKYVSEAEALDYVAGYCTVNDVSEREFQTKRSGQWTKGKSCDTFGPIGPWLVTADEVPDPQKLKLFCDVDGRRFQDGTTETMVYGVRFLVAYLSQFFTLHPGDIIATGTPPGVGTGQKPPVFLRAGQRLRAGVEGLGEQSQLLVQD